jgi:hypothetical protein
MHVFVVLDYTVLAGRELTTVLGVFSTRERAESCLQDESVKSGKIIERILD